MSDKKTPLDTIREALNYLYYRAYHSGHHDTVEGCYTDVFGVDRLTYHEDVVNDLLNDSDMEPLVAALRSMEGSEPVAWMSEHFTYTFDDEEIVAMSESAAGFRWMNDSNQFDLCAADMARLLTHWRDSLNPPAPAAVELSEEDVKRLSMDAMARPTHDGDVTWIPTEVECSNRAIRHLASKYHLIRKQP